MQNDSFSKIFRNIDTFNFILFQIIQWFTDFRRFSLKVAFREQNHAVTLGSLVFFLIILFSSLILIRRTDSVFIVLNHTPEPFGAWGDIIHAGILGNIQEFGVLTLHGGDDASSVFNDFSFGTGGAIFGFVTFASSAGGVARLATLVGVTVVGILAGDAFGFDADLTAFVGAGGDFAIFFEVSDGRVIEARTFDEGGGGGAFG